MDMHKVIILNVRPQPFRERKRHQVKRSLRPKVPPGNSPFRNGNPQRNPEPLTAIIVCRRNMDLKSVICRAAREKVHHLTRTAA